MDFLLLQKKLSEQKMFWRMNFTVKSLEAAQVDLLQLFVS